MSFINNLYPSRYCRTGFDNLSHDWLWTVVIAVFYASTFYAATANAQSTLTLVQALERARQSSPDLAIAYHQIDAAKAQVLQGRARPNPELAYFQEDTREATKTTSWQLNQQLELGGKRSARIEAQRIQNEKTALKREKKLAKQKKKQDKAKAKE